MPFNNYLDDTLPEGRAEDNFSLVDFLAEAPDYFAHEPFSIYVSPRSAGINEYLNLKIQLKMGRLKRIKAKILSQLQLPDTQENTTPPEVISAPPSEEEADSSPLIYRKGGKVIEIAVSPEQLKNYFDDKMMEGEAKDPGKPVQEKKHRDIFDRFLHEPGFFQRSEDPEAVPPDHSIEASVTEDDEIVTETLAKINLLQGNRGEARRIYQKLGLLFPEKSAYFEAQIKKIQDLDTTNDA